MRTFYLIIILIVFGCKKDSPTTNSNDQISWNPRSFKIGEKFANGIVIGSKEIPHNDNGPKNIGLKIIGLNDFANLNFRESLNEIQTLKDQYGEWNFGDLNFRNGIGPATDNFKYTYSTIIEDSIVKSGGKIIEKNVNYWQNGYNVGRPIVQRINKTLGTDYDVYKSSDDSLIKNKLRPTRLVVYYNTPLKTFKVGQEYNYGSLIFSVDSINRKIKIFNSGISSDRFNWEKCNLIVKESMYDGSYGFRLPTVDEIKTISTVTTINIRCWTSTVDPNNSKNVFVFESLQSPQIRSTDKVNYISNSSIIGVKEISY